VSERRLSDVIIEGLIVAGLVTTRLNRRPLCCCGGDFRVERKSEQKVESWFGFSIAPFVSN